MDNQSKVNERLLERLERIYADAEDVMLSKVAAKIDKGLQVTGWTAEKMSEVESIRKDIQKLMNDTNKIVKTEVSQSLIDTYLNGVNAQNKHYGLPKSIMGDEIPYSLQRLILESEGLIDGTSFQVLRQTDDAYREVISHLSTGILTGTETKQQVAQKALNSLAAKGITGFVDKAGRKWNLASYVDMAVRTTTARAALQGHTDRATELGYDLIKVSSVFATCQICAPWNGKVISISGNSLKYPSLDNAKAAGLFHPNCKHTISAYSEDEEELDKILGNDFSANTKADAELYKATQVQRSNERQIRKYKRLESVALDPASKAKAMANVKKWQGVQREHVEKYNLTRMYGREQVARLKGDIPSIPKYEKLKLEAPKPKVAIDNDVVVKDSLDNEVNYGAARNADKYVKASLLLDYQKDLGISVLENIDDEKKINEWIDLLFEKKGMKPEQKVQVKAPITKVLENAPVKKYTVKQPVTADDYKKVISYLTKEELADVHNSFMEKYVGKYYSSTKEDVLKTYKETGLKLPTIKKKLEHIVSGGNVENLAAKAKVDEIIRAKYNVTAPKAAKKIENVNPKQPKQVTAKQEPKKVPIKKITPAEYSNATKMSNDEFVDFCNDEMKNNGSREREFLKQHKDWFTNIDSRQQEGVTQYTSYYYEQMNSWLRGYGAKPSQEVLDYIEGCADALKDARFEKDIVVRRGSDMYSLAGITGKYEEINASGGNFRKWLLEHSDELIGTVAEDKGFMSTTPIMERGFSPHGVEYRILAPKGTRAAYVDPISAHEGEKEVLFQRNTRFIIRDIKRAYGKTLDKSGDDLMVFLEAIPMPD